MLWLAGVTAVHLLTRSGGAVKAMSVKAARATLDELGAKYATAPPHTLAGPTADLLAVLVANLRAANMLPSERAELLAIATDTALLRGHSAFAAGHTDVARDSFTLAGSLAEEADKPELIARALGSRSILHSAVGGNGQPHIALDLLNQARAESEPGLFRLWVELHAAREYAAIADRYASYQALEIAYEHYPRGEGFGFFSRSAYFAGFDVFYLAGWSGLILGMLGVTAAALAELGIALDYADANRRARNIARLYVDIAVTYAAAGEPERACAAAIEALDECALAGYGLGTERIRQLRAGVPEAWEGLVCMRELDERLWPV